MGVGLCAVVGLRLNYRRIKRAREAMSGVEYSEEEKSEKGDRASTFR